MSRSNSNHHNLGAVIGSMIICIVAITLSASGDESATSKAIVNVPAADLDDQLSFTVTRIDGLLAKPDEYDEARQSRIAKEADLAAVVALGLGMAKEDHPHKRTASTAIAAAQALAKADSYAAAKQALDELKQAARAKPPADSPAPPTQWKPVAPLGLLMKEVPIVNSSLKRAVQGERFKSQTKISAAAAAALAAIAQEAATDHDAIKKPADLPKWEEYCAEMRDAAGRVNRAIHASNAADTEQAMAQLAQSCDHCHRAFRK
jgi:hypothetical protein